MPFLPLLKGIAFGLSVAAPVGPIGLLCIRRTLQQGQLIGLVSGLGAATADGFYGCVAGLGLTVVSDMLVNQGRWLGIVGGLFLCYLGITTFLAKPSTTASEVSGRGLVGAYSSTLLLTLTNPTTILTFIAVFAGLGIADPGQSRGAALLLVVGVFLGSALWWLTLSWGVNLLRSRLQPHHLRWLNRVAGVVIFAFGVVALKLP